MKSTNVPSDAYEDVKALDGHRCAWCVLVGIHEHRDVQFHHRLPRSRAKNQHDRFNGVMLCLAHHAEAHRASVWPWTLPGSMLRGEYIGGDLITRAIYNGGPIPSVEDVAQDMVMELPLFRLAVVWAVDRAHHARAAGVGKE